MPNSSCRKSRALRLALVAAMLWPNQAFARELPDIDLGTIKVLVKERQPLTCGGPGVNPIYGSVGQKAPGEPFTEGSPAIDPAPSFHSGNKDLSVWGLGWTSDIDHSIALNGNNTITWTDGQGVHISYVQVPGPSTAPVYVPPVNAYETITTVAASSGVPNSLLERDLDGTTRRFDVFESSSILRLALLTDKNGNTIAYTRDAQGRLTHVEDVHGRYFNLAYNPAGLVETLSDSGGRSSAYVYDVSKRRISDAGPLGTTAYLYDPSNRMIKITYPNGSVKNYAYDAQNRVLSENDGAGVNAQSYVYYQSSTTVTDALGRVVKYDYITLKGLKKISKITDPNGGVTTFLYDGNLNLLSSTDPLGRVTAYTYDPKGNVIRTDDPAGGHTLASYEPNFNVVATLTDPRANMTHMTYDERGNLIIVEDALSGKVNKDYDGQGHVIESRDPLGHPTAFSYEPANGALKAITDPLTRQTNMLTDGLSRVVKNTDPSGKVTEYVYDPASNLTQVKDALGGLTRYVYAPGRDKKLLEKVTDANGHATTFGYDPQGRLKSVTNALGQVKTSTYDDKGNLIETKNARGQKITYEYNSRDLLIKKIFPEGNITYAYDAAGNLTDTQNYNGSRIQTRYDTLNRVIQTIQTLPGGYSATIDYGYDGNSNRTSMITPWGPFSYEYDELNRLRRITNPQERRFDFAYDAAGRRTQLSYPNGIKTTYGYDDAGQVLSIIHMRTSDSAIVAKSTYSYDGAGNRLTMTDLQGTHAYSYDDLHRLMTADHPQASALETKVEAFSYDATGNRLADARITGYAYNEANRLIENSSFTYTYDADGNRTGIEDKLTHVTTNFSFNSENQLIGVTKPDGAAWTYEYDRIGRRVERSSGTAASQKSRYVYDGDNLLAILDNNNNLRQSFTTGLGLDEPIELRLGDGIELLFHSDSLGSVRAMTDSSGSNVANYEYLSFGSPVAKNAAGAIVNVDVFENRLLFTARVFDVETGLEEMRHRYFDQQTGVFVSEDPAGAKGGINSYEYAWNSPLKYIDPTGTDAVLVQGNTFWEYHNEVWIGNPLTGYTPIGFGPAGWGGVWSSATGSDVSGSDKERSVQTMLPWPVPLIGANVHGPVRLSAAQDAELLAYAKGLSKLPQWQKYNAYKNNCQDYAQIVLGRALQLQRGK